MMTLVMMLAAGLFAFEADSAPTPTPDQTEPAKVAEVESAAETEIEDESDAGRLHAFVLPETPRPSVDAVIQGFLADLATRDEFPSQARTHLANSFSKLEPSHKGEFLNSGLALLSDGFRIGLESLERDEPEKAADIFEALTIDDNPYLAVASACQAATALVDLDQIDRCGRMLGAVMEAHPDIEQYTLAPDIFVFMLGYCQLHELNYEAAPITLRTFLARYPQASERLRTTATQILTELDRRVPGKLGDVRDLMNFARRRIHNGDTGEVVASRQAAAVELLSAMIDEAESQEKSKSGCKKCGGGKCKGGHGAPKGNTNPNSGAKQSNLPGGESRVGELRKTQARPGEEWGRMPARERDQILQTLQRQFPSQYRELLEQYYQQLAKDAQPR